MTPANDLKDPVHPAKQGIAMSAADNSASLAMQLFAAEVPPQQEIRELLENSMQAIDARCQREGRDLGGEVQFCMYPLSQKRYGVSKLACIDNGEGMAPLDLYRFINQIYSSGRVTGVQENYGIGAKIAALNANPAGVVYETWQAGRGYRITMRRFEDGTYGSEMVDHQEAIVVDGVKIIEPIPTSEMPLLVRDSGGFGTMVVLLGKDRERSNTLAAPENHAGKKGEWIAWTINNRYFDIPKGITVNTSTASSRAPKVWTEARGLRAFLDEYQKKSGTIHLSDCDLHWGILKHHKSYRNEKKLFDSGAKVGVLHDGELYDYLTQTAAQNRLQHSFGIPFGANTIALLFEPHDANPTQSRADLKINSESVPWERWQKEFRNNMPQAIRKHIQEQNRNIVRSGKNVVKMLSNLNSYRRQNKRQRSGDGKRIGGDLLQSLQKVSATASVGGSAGTSSSSAAGTESTRSALQKSGALLAPGTKRLARRKSVPFTEDDLPQCAWVSNVVYGMGGRFMRYLPIDNQIILNQDFPLYKEVVDKWLSRTDSVWKESVLETIQEEFAMQAVEAVLSIKDQEGDEGYSPQSVQELLADDRALSLVATQRVRLEESLGRRLKNYCKEEKTQNG